MRELVTEFINVKTSTGDLKGIEEVYKSIGKNRKYTTKNFPDLAEMNLSTS